MTVDELKAKLESAPIGADVKAVDIDGVECDVTHVQVNDEEVFLSLEDPDREHSDEEVGEVGA